MRISFAGGGYKVTIFGQSDLTFPMKKKVLSYCRESKTIVVCHRIQSSVKIWMDYVKLFSLWVFNFAIDNWLILKRNTRKSSQMTR